jgi:glycosyltransferase involved in cell wall biosynthesis
MRWLWRAVTKVEKRFYQRGYDSVVVANALVAKGDFAEAQKLLSGPLPRYVRPAAELVRANMYLNDDAKWVQHLNAYLDHFGSEPVVLKAAANRMLGLATRPLPPVQGGPMVSVIMAVHNAEQTVGMAVRSILNQTWQKLELIAIDDASSDGSWHILKDLATQDPRIILHRNSSNVGPYVCRNLALHLPLATGSLITCHDADDWAHPQRLQQHVAAAMKDNCLSTTSLTYCLRMKEAGVFSGIAEARPRSPDGAAQVANVSLLCDREFFINKLGAWDCVKFSGDSELIARAGIAQGRAVRRFMHIAMICLESQRTLSGNPNHGGNPRSGLSPVRWRYREAYEKWHACLQADTRLTFPPLRREFDCPDDMVVPLDRLAGVVAAGARIN